MDIKVSIKEERLQPSGPVDVIVSDTFDLYLIMDQDDPDLIVGAETYEGFNETQQQAYFASVRQLGSDPVDPDVGNRWAEVFMGELDAAALVTDIKNSVQSVSINCSVEFGTRIDAAGNELLNYYIKVGI